MTQYSYQIANHMRHTRVYIYASAQSVRSPARTHAFTIFTMFGDGNFFQLSSLPLSLTRSMCADIKINCEERKKCVKLLCVACVRARDSAQTSFSFIGFVCKNIHCVVPFSFCVAYSGDYIINKCE